MYGSWWAYDIRARLRQAQSQPSCGTTQSSEVAFARPGDLWIFIRLTAVLAVFFAGLACILWVAS